MRPIQLALIAALTLVVLAWALAHALGRVGAAEALDSSSPAPLVADPRASAVIAPPEIDPQRSEARTDPAIRYVSTPGQSAPQRPGRSLYFRVEDETGEPLAGALVRAIGKPSVQSLPTNSSGEGHLDGVQPTHRVLLVGAPERRVLRVPFGRGGEDPERPLVFVLPPGNRLEIILRGRRGELLDGVLIELSTQSQLFEGTHEWGPTSLHLSISGTAFTEASWSKRGGRVTFRTEADGGVRLSGIRPHVPLRVVVRDVLRRVICEEQFQGPGTGELLQREFVLDASLVELAGRVFDDDGNSLFRARVELRGEGGAVRTSTDLMGRFEFLDGLVSSSPLELWATLDGYDPLRLQGLVLGPDAGLPPVVLHRGPGFLLSVVDQDGNPVHLLDLKAEVPGYPTFQGRITRAGQYRFAEFPPGRISLTARVGPHTFEREFDPSGDPPTWVLPTLGRLVVTLAKGVPLPDRSSRFVVRVISVNDPTLVQEAHLTSNGSTSVLHLAPGMWSVQLHRLVAVDGRMVMEPHATSVEVELHAGELQQLDLE